MPPSLMTGLECAKVIRKMQNKEKLDAGLKIVIVSGEEEHTPGRENI